MKDADASYPVRFVAVERSTANEEPGKSGGLLLRELRKHARVAKNLTCTPDRIASLPETVKVLIFIDDIIGSGSQFGKFAKAHKLSEYAEHFKMLYCPLMAYKDGVGKVTKDHPWVTICPIELLSAKNRFFCSAPDHAERWALDKVNLVTDVRDHVSTLATNAAIPPATRYSLDLLVAFEHATPNNTLSLLWSQSDNWHSLLNR